MTLLFILNQQHLDIAIAEAKAAAYGKTWWQHRDLPIDGTLLLASRRLPKYLSLSHNVSRIIAQCAPGNLRTTLASMNWQRVLKNSRYKVQLTKQSALVNSKESERELANIIWHTIQRARSESRSRSQESLTPVVDLDHPDLIIDIVLTSSIAYIGTRIWTNTEDFQSRRAHLRPVLHPSSMHPALSRAIVNISCAKTIHDPCCGTGGLLIEAGLAHVHASGADIDAAMVAGARKNCLAYHLCTPLRVADATMWMPRCGCIIADLPYGKNTSPVALAPFIEAFMHRAAKATSRVILGVPSELPMPRGWDVRAHLTDYVHKSMTKHFYVLEKK